MTAGTIVCCVPTTAAVLPNIKISPSSIFSCSGRALKSSLKSSVRHEELESASELRNIKSGRLVPVGTSNEWRVEEWFNARSDRIPKSGITFKHSSLCIQNLCDSTRQAYRTSQRRIKCKSSVEL